MLRHSSFGTVCLLMAVTLLGTTFGASINDTSGELLSSFAKSKILLMGVLGHNLLIITKDSPSMVFEVAMAKYDNSQIDLYGVVPAELKNKWPVLYGNENFTKRVLNGGRVWPFSIEMDKETLIFIFHQDVGSDFFDTVTFTLKPPSATFQEFKMYDKIFHLEQSHLISSEEPNAFFNLQITDEGFYQLSKYIKKSDGFSSNWKFGMCKKSDGNGSEVIVFEKPYSDCAHVDWQIENGSFMYQNRFHIFTKDQVHIFEFTGTSSSGVALKVVKLSNFFVSIIPTTTSTTTVGTSTRKATNMMVIIIVAVVVSVVVFAIIALAIWLFCRSKKQPKPQINGNKSKDTKKAVKNSAMLNKCSTGSNAMSQKQTQVSKGSSNVPTKSASSATAVPQSSPKKGVTSAKMTSKAANSMVSSASSIKANKSKPLSSSKGKSKPKSPTNLPKLPKLKFRSQSGTGVPKSESPLRIEFTKTELTFATESELPSLIPPPGLSKSQHEEWIKKNNARSLARTKKYRRRRSRKATKPKQEKKAMMAKQAKQSKYSKASKQVKSKAGTKVSKSSSAH